VVGLFLIIQAPDASDTRSTALILRPVDRFVLDFESAENMVANMVARRRPLPTRREGSRRANARTPNAA
jgi:hypothetical protein